MIDVHQHVEGAALKALVVEPETRVLEDEDLDAVAALVEEHEDVAGARIHVELVARDPGQPLVCVPAGFDARELQRLVAALEASC